MARVLVRLNGTLGSSAQEKWSITLNHRVSTALTEAETTSSAVAIGEMLETTWGTDYPLLRDLLSSSGALTDVDVYSYGASGPALFGSSYATTSPLLGTGTITCPPQCACVISLLTGFSGASRRGRVYWPALGAAVNSALVDTTMPAVGEEFAQFAQAIQEILELLSDADLAVYSPTTGVVTPVTRISVGNVVDTQRRRRDALAEFRVNWAYPPG